MLHYEAVKPRLLELLRMLMRKEFLNSFRLVGGTALALQLGHRDSVDIDLFGDDYLDDIELRTLLNDLGQYTPLKQSKVIKIFEVNKIKIDFVTYKYPWLEEPIIEDGLRLASKKDIAAMKLNAIAGRGSKKDFIDLFYLLHEFSYEELISFYLEKYHDGSEFLILKSLTYFEDANTQEMPKMFTNDNWNEMKKVILENYDKYIGHN